MLDNVITMYHGWLFWRTEIDGQHDGYGRSQLGSQLLARPPYY